MENNLEVAGVEAAEKVLFATHYLARPARAWWTNTCAMNAGQVMTWADFKLKFSKYHVPPGLIKKMRDEFRELKKGRMSVVEYRDRPFLNTAGAVIDCNKGKVTFNVDDKEHTVYFPKRIDKEGLVGSRKVVNAYIEGMAIMQDGTEEAEEHLDLSSDAASSSHQHFGHEEPSPFLLPGPYYDYAMYDPPAWNPALAGVELHFAKA
ncbi:hypothetical protein QYE76_009457 [Lolium multiflorum]|uniref:Retrotransposon gag domain-containing protein n=1 Tax=Lolium multiflorum TaxID=4521 RepID=A0AAD8TVC6_LOLMU|nr:hypothetical protein QYE76_009457 [Lolium multiflorum]